MADQALIKILRGQWRGLGDTGSGLGLIFDFNFREYLHYFQGASLSVLMAISLHADEQGRAWPSYDLLEKETGYKRDAIARALNYLCTLEIDHSRVLLRYRVRDGAGHFTGSNRYIIFPTPEELTQYTAGPESENQTMAEDTPESENQTMVDSQSLILPKLENAEVGKSTLEVKPLNKVKPDSNLSTPISENQPALQAWGSGLLGGEVKNPRAAAALEKAAQRQTNGLDLSNWPEDVRPWLEAVSNLWGLIPPVKPNKSGGQFATWIKELRALQQACRDSLNVLYLVHADFMADSVKIGRAPFTVARPQALVNSAAAKVAWLSQQQAQQITQTQGPDLTEFLAQQEKEKQALQEKRRQMIARAQGLGPAPA